MANGLVERGAKWKWLRIAEEPTRMRGKAQTIVRMVDQAHQRLDLGQHRDGIQNANAVRQIQIQEFDELRRAFLGKLDIEEFVRPDHPHGKRWTERELGVTAVTGRVGDGNARTPQRPIHEPHDIEMRDETQGIRLLKTHSVAP